MHYFIIIVVIDYVIVKQYSIWKDTKSKLNDYKGIFPDDLISNLKVYNSILFSPNKLNEYNKIKGELLKLKLQKNNIEKTIGKLNREIQTITPDTEEYSNVESQINGQTNQRKNTENEIAKIESQLKNFDYSFNTGNEICNTIISSINNYLIKNKNTTSDFNLIKDIVDRNCDAAEEEIQTQIPVPLYYGLIGTMAGILVGVGMLVFSGGLDDLLGNETTSANGNGIVALMGGVALAMVGSIIGIWLTTQGSLKLKTIKSDVEKNKHTFLSWMQAELLPTLSADTASAMKQMTDNLANFNATFSGNTETLSETLSKVNDATVGQADLLKQVQKLKIGQIATANINVYDKLKNCTDEIGHLGQFLTNSTEYLDRVKSLNEQLNESQELLRLVKQMSQFFERTESGLQEVILKSIGSAQDRLEDAVQKFNNSLAEQYQKMIVSTNNQTQKLESTLDEQNEVLKRRLSEFSTLVDEIKNLSSVKSSMDKLEKVTSKQNEKLDTLAQSIQQLSELKTTGGKIETRPSTLQKWAYISIITIVGLVIICIILGLIGKILG